MQESITLANARAIEERAAGNLTGAAAIFREAIQTHPGVAALHQNLAQILYELGENDAAIVEHRAVLEVDPHNVASHLALYELLQIAGRRDEALAHQRSALSRQRVFSNVAPAERRSVLVLCAPGDWQANIPVDFLFDRASTSVHKLFLLDEATLAREVLPPFGVIWNAIAESPEALPYLALAEHFMSRQTKPRLNDPAHVLATSRVLLPLILASTGARTVPVKEVAAERLSSGDVPFEYPIIARPLGSHAGHGLERIADEGEARDYTARVVEESYFVAPFIDYRSEDGFFRKYRIVFVDGTPYPVHLAISKEWMIHYYNAPMAEHAWMRDEERAFLSGIGNTFDGSRGRALEAIAREVGLEYFGIDCAIDRDGTVLVFEADPAMLVHTSDPIELYPYKHEFVPRIYRAVETMLDRRIFADT